MLKNEPQKNDIMKKVIGRTLLSAITDGNYEAVDQIISKNCKNSGISISSFNEDDTSLLDYAFLKWRERIEKFDKGVEDINAVKLSGYKNICLRLVQEGMTSDELKLRGGCIYGFKHHEIKRKESFSPCQDINECILDVIFELNLISVDKVIDGTKPLIVSELKKDLGYIFANGDKNKYPELCDGYIKLILENLHKHAGIYKLHKDAKSAQDKKLKTLATQKIEDGLVMLPLIASQVSGPLSYPHIEFVAESHRLEYERCCKQSVATPLAPDKKTKSVTITGDKKKAQTAEVLHTALSDNAHSTSLSTVKEIEVVPQKQEVNAAKSEKIAKEVTLELKSYIDDLESKHKKEEEKQKLYVEKQRLERIEQEKRLRDIQQKELEKKQHELQKSSTPKSSPKSSPKLSPNTSKKNRKQLLNESVNTPPGSPIAVIEIPTPMSLSLFSSKNDKIQNIANQSTDNEANLEHYTVNGISVHRTPLPGKESKRYNQLSKTQAIALRNWKKAFNDELIKCLLSLHFNHKQSVYAVGGYVLNMLYQLPFTDADFIIGYKDDLSLENAKNMLLQTVLVDYKVIDAGTHFGEGYQYSLMTMKSKSQVECDLVFVKEEHLERHFKPFSNIYGLMYDVINHRLRDIGDSINSFGNRDLKLSAPAQDIANIRLLVFFAKLLNAKRLDWHIESSQMENYLKNLRNLKFGDIDYVYKVLIRYLNKNTQDKTIAHELIFIMHEFKDSLYAVIGLDSVQQFECWLKMILDHSNKGEPFRLVTLREFSEAVKKLDFSVSGKTEKLMIADQFKTLFVITHSKQNVASPSENTKEETDIAYNNESSTSRPSPH